MYRYVDAIFSANKTNLVSAKGMSQGPCIEGQAIADDYRSSRFVYVAADEKAAVSSGALHDRLTARMVGTHGQVESCVCRGAVAKKHIGLGLGASSNIVFAPLIAEAEPIGSGSANTSYNQFFYFGSAKIDVSFALQVGQVVIAGHPEQWHPQRTDHLQDPFDRIQVTRIALGCSQGTKGQIG